jgi:hypothetical protein
MSVRYEGADAREAGTGWEEPGTEIGEDTLAPGQYALTINYDEVFYISGSPKGLRDFMVRLDEQLQEIEAHAAKPLALADYKIDDDGEYACPRCDEYFAPANYDDLAKLVAEVGSHILMQHDAPKEKNHGN